jgi:hypothetical protein
MEDHVCTLLDNRFSDEYKEFGWCSWTWWCSQVFRSVDRKKILHYRQLYLDRPEQIAFMSVSVNTSGHIYDDFLRLLFLHAHREASALAHEIPEESGQFRFLRSACLDNIEGSVGLIFSKDSVMRISIPLDLSSHPFILLPRFIRSRRSTSLLDI